MRKGEEAADWELGGAWHCAVRMLDGESGTCDALKSESMATKTSERDGASAEAGRTKCACMDGLVSQHSWLCSWLCEEQCIVSQHCIARSGVIMSPQSITYPAIARAIANRKTDFTRYIPIKLDALGVCVKIDCPATWTRERGNRTSPLAFHRNFLPGSRCISSLKSGLLFTGKVDAGQRLEVRLREILATV
jgi:hypothetical protein